MEGARVRVLNTATGVTVNLQSARGRFLVLGLDVGGPYVVEVLHIGFLPQRSRQLFLTLGEPLDAARNSCRAQRVANTIAAGRGIMMIQLAVW